jgi:RHS repeat-associated protein
VNGRKNSMVDAVANAAGNPVLGTTTLGYDRLGRVTSKSFSDGTPTVSWTYDLQGRVATMTDGTGTTTYAYDTANRVVSVVNGAGVTMTYGWDANNNLTDLNDGKQTFTRTYDTLDRLTGVVDAASGPVVNYGYDADGNTTSMTYPGGTTQTRTVDRAGQLSGLTNTTAAGLLRSYTYTRDQIGSPTKVVVNGPTGVLAAESQVFEFDGASRLKKQCWTATTCTAAGQTTWAYDGLGRRASEKIGSALATTFAYDAADQIVSTTQGTVVKSFAYNANGDQTVGPGVVSTFNTAHQTVSVAAPGGTVTYGYDGNGNRTSSTVGGVTTRFDWDNIGSGLPNVTAESIAGAVIRKYAYGHDMVRTTDGTTNSFLLADPVGTITHLVSGSGAVQAQYLTGAYGANKTTTVTDPAVATNPIRYTGQYTDPVTGNIHLRARQYNPTLGMFTQTDPMPRGAGSAYESSYVYGRNNPLRFTDPSGLRATACKAPDWRQTFKLYGAALNPFSGDFNECENRQAQAVVGVHEGVIPGGEATTSAAGAIALNPIARPAIGPAVGGAAIVVGGVFATVFTAVKVGDAIEELTKAKPKPKKQQLYRFGGWPEPAEKLQAEGEMAAVTPGFFFGVSTSLRKSSRLSNKCASFETVLSLFPGTRQTGRRLEHFTVALDDPVSSGQAALFNSTFIPC